MDIQLKRNKNVINASQLDTYESTSNVDGTIEIVTTELEDGTKENVLCVKRIIDGSPIQTLLRANGNAEVKSEYIINLGETTETAASDYAKSKEIIQATDVRFILFKVKSGDSISSNGLIYSARNTTTSCYQVKYIGNKTYCRNVTSITTSSPYASTWTIGQYSLYYNSTNNSISLRYAPTSASISTITLSNNNGLVDKFGNNGLMRWEEMGKIISGSCNYYRNVNEYDFKYDDYSVGWDATHYGFSNHTSATKLEINPNFLWSLTTESSNAEVQEALHASSYIYDYILDYCVVNNIALYDPKTTCPVYISYPSKNTYTFTEIAPLLNGKNTTLYLYTVTIKITPSGTHPYECVSSAVVQPLDTNYYKYNSNDCRGVLGDELFALTTDSTQEAIISALTTYALSGDERIPLSVEDLREIAKRGLYLIDNNTQGRVSVENNGGGDFFNFIEVGVKNYGQLPRIKYAALRWNASTNKWQVMRNSVNESITQSSTVVSCVNAVNTHAKAINTITQYLGQALDDIEEMKADIANIKTQLTTMATSLAGNGLEATNNKLQIKLKNETETTNLLAVSTDGLGLKTPNAKIDGGEY